MTITRNIRILLLYALIPFVILMLSRTIFAAINCPLSTLTDNAGDLPLALCNMLRFDLMVTAYTMILPSLLVIVSTRAIRIYFTFVAFIFTTLTFIDLGFYRNFGTHINITFFDFFNEEPLSLVVAIWDEYPVVWMLLALTLVTFATYRIGEHIEKKVSKIKNNKKVNIWHRIVYILVYLTVLFLCLRGSVSEFPLQIEDTRVSACIHINNLVPNAPYMLKDAWMNKNNSFNIDNQDDIIGDSKFTTIDDAIKVFTDRNDIHCGKDTLATLQKVLFAHAGDNLSTMQPNVLFIFSESWSNYLMELDSPKHNLLSGMRKHLKEDLLWRNYQSVCNGTVATLENFILSTPFPRFFGSKYAYKMLLTSVTVPFRNSGYECEFISGMDQEWENTGAALIHQGFDKVSGKYELLKKHPEYNFNSVGVYDHHLLNTVLEEINDTTNHKPRMTIVMTTTNHPPFVYPDDVKIPTYDNDILRNKCFNNVGDDVLRKYLNGYAYYNKVLGDFLTLFKASPAARNTIIVITGDHNVRSILDYKNIPRRWQNSVPLYIYLPPYLRTMKYPDQRDVWGCHYDIIPTIAPFAFRNTEYVCLGKNLISDNFTADNSYSYNEMQTLASDIYKDIAERKVDACNTLLRLYFIMYIKKYQINKYKSYYGKNMDR